jgi:ABC-type multidrug transport system ATPase subunit
MSARGAATEGLVADSIAMRFGERRVLSAATLRAVPGEVRALLGRSGAGKSTLMKIAAGWMAPDSGVVRLEREARLRWSPAALAARGVFYLPDTGALGSALPIERQLRMFAERFPGSEPPMDALRRLGLAQQVAMPPQLLSGGEQRRADVAAIFVRRPRVLLADEPLRGIAPIDQERILDAFKALAVEGCAVVVTGHDVAALLEAADHVSWCTSGTTYELGPPSAARAHERFVMDYLGTR